MGRRTRDFTISLNHKPIAFDYGLFMLIGNYKQLLKMRHQKWPKMPKNCYKAVEARHEISG